MSSARSPITTHVLDLASGRPGKGMRVFLRVKEAGGGGGALAGSGGGASGGPGGGEEWREIARGVTDMDGRVMSLLPSGVTISAGTYQLRFDTLSYFKENLSSLPSFFPEITITFVVTDPSAHYHIPLLLSPFGYSTYRGS